MTIKIVNLALVAYLFISLVYLSSYLFGHIRQQYSTVSVYSKLNQQLPPNEHSISSQHYIWANNKDVISNNNDILTKSFSQSMGSGQLLPFYYKAEIANFVPHEVTVTTLVTPGRFDALKRLAHHYQGPISAVLHIYDGEEQTHILEQVKNLYETQASMRLFVDLHILVDKYERQFNLWRNIAKLYARTDYILMLDVDFLVTPTIRQILPSLPPKIMDSVRQGKAALVVPAFEELEQKKVPSSSSASSSVVKDNSSKPLVFPASKQELLQQVEDGRIDMFHKFWLKGHGSTNYTKWYASSSIYKVTDYNFSYEPYVIIKKEGTAWCDERFIGYGANKAACHFELYISGIDYFVLPDDYLLHKYHPYPENTRSYERQLNRKLYENFREEICFRYARSMMARGQWNTKKAGNAKRECRKIRHWSKLIRGVH